MKTTLTIALPIEGQAFGGIVGSRLTATTVQIAYLERGGLTRVRFIEETLPQGNCPLILEKISPRFQGKNLVLDVEIESGPEKESTSQKE
jgi:hypothetical protein